MWRPQPYLPDSAHFIAHISQTRRTDYRCRHRVRYTQAHRPTGTHAHLQRSHAGTQTHRHETTRLTDTTTQTQTRHNRPGQTVVAPCRHARHTVSQRHAGTQTHRQARHTRHAGATDSHRHARRTDSQTRRVHRLKQTCRHNRLTTGMHTDRRHAGTQITDTQAPGPGQARTTDRSDMQTTDICTTCRAVRHSHSPGIRMQTGTHRLTDTHAHRLTGDYHTDSHTYHRLATRRTQSQT